MALGTPVTAGRQPWHRVVLSAIILALVAALLPPLAPAAHADAGLEAAFVTAANDARATHGLSALTIAGDLVTAAREHSRVMGEVADLHHNPNLGSSVGGWQKLGENVGRGPSVGAIHRALMDSPSHRANILGSDWTQIGIGVVVVDGQIWVTQMFRQPTGVSAPAPAPSPEQDESGPANQSPGSDSPSSGSETPSPGPTTPSPGSETPSSGSETPSSGSETPSSGAATPSSGPTTPSPGSETPSSGGGDRADSSWAPADQQPHPVAQQALALDRTSLLLARQAARDGGSRFEDLLEELRAELQRMDAAA